MNTSSTRVNVYTSSGRTGLFLNDDLIKKKKKKKIYIYMHACVHRCVYSYKGTLYPYIRHHDMYVSFISCYDMGHGTFKERGMGHVWLFSLSEHFTNV